MKKFLIAVLVVLVCFTSVTAQSYAGLRVGYVGNQAFINNNGSKPDTAYGSGFEATLFGNFLIAGGFSIQPEVSFVYASMQKYHTKNVLLGVTTENDIDVLAKALEIPLLVKYEFALDDDGKLGIFLGPQFSFGVGNLTGKSVEIVKNSGIPGGDGTTEREISTSYEDNHTAKFVVSGLAGVDYAMPMGAGVFVVDFRLSYDFTNLYTGTNADKDTVRRFQVKPSIGYGITF